MSPNSAPFLIPFLLSAMLSFALAFYAINFFRVPGAIPFSAMTLIQSGWTVFMILGLVSPTIQEKRFWDSVQWALVFLVTAAVYWFTHSILPVKRKALVPWWLLFILPVLFMTLLLIDPTLVYPGGYIDKSFAFNIHTFSFSLLDWLGFIHAYALLYYCIAVLWIERRRTTGQMRRKLTWALVGITVQSVLYQVLFMANVNILGQRDTSPFTFLVGNFIMGWGLFRNRIFELGSIARSQVVETMADGFIVTDAQGLLVDMNRAARNIAIPNWDQRIITDAFPDWSREIKSEDLGLPLTQDFVHVIEGIQHSFELRVTPLTDSHQAVVGHLIMLRDLSEGKKLESALAASEARYRSIIDAMAEGVSLHDQNGAILTCNRAAETILGRTFQQLEGRSAGDMTGLAIHEDGSPFSQDSAPVSIALRTRKPVRDVVMGVKNAAGTVTWLLINAQPFNFIDPIMGQTHQVIVSFRDVTELRQIQAEANRAVVAQEQSRLVAQFVQSASHEFRTPLAVIGTRLYLMSRQQDAARRQGHAEVAEREIKRIVSLMDTLVNLVQLDSGIPLELYPTQIDSLLCSSVGRFESRAKDHHIHMRVTAPQTLPAIKVDSNYLTIGIEQVLDNALRYTPDHGRIDVSVTVEGKQVVLKVQDTGLGINAEELEHIFDRFWRRDSAHSTPGFGLGLSIVQKVVERHEGTIAVESTVGHGTLVIIKLPL